MALTACTPMQQTYTPAPQRTVTPTLWLHDLQTSDGTRLPLHRYWHTPSASPRAIILALHGFNDYGNAFALPALYLNQHGIAVLAIDQRGFGATSQRGIWAHEANLIQDTLDFIRATKLAYPHTPLYLLGESMGGAVAAITQAQHPLPELQGIILSAPATWGQNTMSPLYRGVLWSAAHLAPSTTLTGKQAKVLASDNTPMLIALGNDPKIIKKTRIDAVYGLVQLMDNAQQAVHHLRKPTLILYGQNDQIIPSRAIATLAHDTLPAGSTLAYYPQGYHMLLRDLHANTVLGDIIAWISTPQAPLPSGFDHNWQQRISQHKGRR